MQSTQTTQTTQGLEVLHITAQICMGPEWKASDKMSQQNAHQIGCAKKTSLPHCRVSNFG